MLKLQFSRRVRLFRLFSCLLALLCLGRSGVSHSLRVQSCNSWSFYLLSQKCCFLLVFLLRLSFSEDH